MFKLSSKVAGDTAAFEYLPGTSGESFSMGEALQLSSGLLTKATTAPAFICLAEAKGDGVSGVPVMRVMDTQEYETTFAVAPTGLVAGDKVTLHTDGLQVTATKTAGVFTISAIDGTAAGAKATGYFA